MRHLGVLLLLLGGVTSLPGCALCLVGAAGAAAGYNLKGDRDVEFIQTGNEAFSPKPADYEVAVFFEGDRPAQSFRVIGLVYTEAHARTNIFRVSATEVIDRLREEAWRRGADALIDVKIIPTEHRRFDTKRGEGKAIVFAPPSGQ